MNNGDSSRPSGAKQTIKRLLNMLLMPMLHDYTATPPRRSFQDTDAAMALLKPLLRTEQDVSYHRYHLDRYLATMEWLTDLPRSTRVLEIGAPPYGMTLLMRKWMFDDITVTGYEEKSEDQLRVTSQAPVSFRSETGEVLFEGMEDRFNVEIHRWPYPDEQFDLVVSCETFEHLVLDPMHAYAEANRVLKPGGRLFVTVPNGLALSNALRYLHGEQPNSFAFYRPEGFNLRHHREPTPREVSALLQAAGFEPEFVKTFNIAKPMVDGENPLNLLALGFTARPLELRRELLTARGIKRTAVVERYPTSEGLYYEWDVARLRRKSTAEPLPSTIGKS